MVGHLFQNYDIVYVGFFAVYNPLYLLCMGFYPIYNHLYRIYTRI